MAKVTSKKREPSPEDEILAKIQKSIYNVPQLRNAKIEVSIDKKNINIPHFILRGELGSFHSVQLLSNAISNLDTGGVVFDIKLEVVVHSYGEKHTHSHGISAGHPPKKKPEKDKWEDQSFRQ
jgi:hypothetical protein